MSELTHLSIADAANKLQTGKVSSEELVKAHIAVMERFRDLNAFITETPEIALQRAKESDARRVRGEVLGPMDGIPIAVKDLFCTAGVLTTAGSHILENFV